MRENFFRNDERDALTSRADGFIAWQLPTSVRANMLNYFISSNALESQIPPPPL